MAADDRLVPNPRAGADPDVRQLPLLFPDGNVEAFVAVLLKPAHDMHFRGQQHVVLDRAETQVAKGTNVHALPNANARVNEGHAKANAGIFTEAIQREFIKTVAEVVAGNPGEQAHVLRKTRKRLLLSQNERLQKVKKPDRKNDYDRDQIGQPFYSLLHRLGVRVQQRAIDPFVSLQHRGQLKMLLKALQ